MTSFSVETIRFSDKLVAEWGTTDPRRTNWPVVYTLDGQAEIYVGETLNATGRLRQHLANPSKQGLAVARVIVDTTFNKSVCLDLESYLIRLFAGDGKYSVLNGNAGITDRDYYEREHYQEIFAQIFAELRNEGLFQQSIETIQNGDLFKLSPFKSLTPDQAGAVEGIMDGLFEDLSEGLPSTSVVQGDPGTGKTIIGIFLMKLLRDIQLSRPEDDDYYFADSAFSQYFLQGHRDLLSQLRMGLVVPQQSLRDSIRKVFKRTPGLDASMVLTPFDVGVSKDVYDILVVDEAHRLNHRANQSSGMNNSRFREINVALFGADNLALTQLDWILDRSRHQIFLLDRAQSVRPADLPGPAVDRLLKLAGSRHQLKSQMRVQAGGDYVAYVRQLLNDGPVAARSFPNYDLRFFDDLNDMRREIKRLDQRFGLARMVAGYAWPWQSKKNKAAFDIEEGGARLRWNRAEKDWISSAGSVEEVGSIHTVQGYDLNYAGVIIGPDLGFDPEAGRFSFNRGSYFDKKGMENNVALGITYTDDDLLVFIKNIYGVLLTRGMLGTFVYVADPLLREHLRPSFPQTTDPLMTEAH